MSKLWEVDPETKAKLLEIQKQVGNNVCVDCGAPSPQWASPKFGVFMCLTCSGIHRGLGVHISFIRSVTMDGFKVSELQRMQMGGNKAWQDFFNNHKDNQLEGRTFDDSTIKDRYDSEVGEEWKERLSAKVEGREYVPGVKTIPKDTGSGVGSSRAQTPIGRIQGRASPARSSSPMNPSRKVQNETYFAKMGQENASRRDDVPPSQGGKYGGFGSDPMPSKPQNGDWLEEMSKDPLSGLTKGFGWLSTNAKTGYEGWVKPNVQKLAESDFSKQARQSAMDFGQTVQAGTRSAADSLSRFVEGDELSRGHARNFSSAAPEKADFWDSFGEVPKGPGKEKKDFWDSFGSAPRGPTPDKKDFWDSFSDAADMATAPGASKQSSSIGTSAMRKGGPSTSAQKKSNKDDDWGEW